MKLLSIDVGIKNLAYCLLDTSENKIIAWDVINLCGQDPCCSSDHCKKKAKFMLTANHYFCQLHAKKSGLILPTATISLKKIKKMKMVDLQKVVCDYSIPLAASSGAIKKEDLLKQVMAFMEVKMLNSVAGLKANDMDLIEIGIAMRNAFDTELKLHRASIDTIVIENQISPIANRMKTLQGMIAQYFIMHDKTKIIFVSAANKLKGQAPAAQPQAPAAQPQAPAAQPQAPAAQPQAPAAQPQENDITTPNNKKVTTTYADRKKEGVKVTLKLLNEKHTEWLTHFNTHKKKDDLADSFLQGVWYMNSV
jgi:hypothetical protein